MPCRWLTATSEISSTLHSTKPKEHFFFSPLKHLILKSRHSQALHTPSGTKAGINLFCLCHQLSAVPLRRAAPHGYAQQKPCTPRAAKWPEAKHGPCGKWCGWQELGSHSTPGPVWSWFSCICHSDSVKKAGRWNHGHWSPLWTGFRLQIRDTFAMGR